MSSYAFFVLWPLPECFTTKQSTVKGYLFVNNHFLDDHHICSYCNMRPFFRFLKLVKSSKFFLHSFEGL